MNQNTTTSYNTIGGIYTKINILLTRRTIYLFAKYLLNLSRKEIYIYKLNLDNFYAHPILQQNMILNYNIYRRILFICFELFYSLDLSRIHAMYICVS